MDQQITTIRRQLLKWGRGHFRSFWWREDRDPYVISIVEVLLRQTRAEAVELRIRRFLEKYPSPENLACAPIGALIEDLAPFGLHEQRARQLKALGISLVQGEALSNDEGSLLALPGIGPYTAAAVRCFAFGVPVPAVDVNVARIIARVFGISAERGELRKNTAVKAAAEKLLDGPQPRRVNWALLDLGALVCTARRPSCSECPLSRVCEYAIGVGRADPPVA